MRKLFFIAALVLSVSAASAQQEPKNVQSETVTRKFTVDPTTGKRKYITETKTQKMWNEILATSPGAVRVAEKYNVNIKQNNLYKKPVKN